MSKVAKRYAASLHGLAQELNVLDAVNNDMELVAATCDASKDLSLLLKNPIVHTDKKLTVLKKIFGKSANKVTLAFFDIITRKRREPHLEAIAKEYTHVFKHNKGIETAVITSAIGLDDKLRKEILSVVKNITKSEIELTEKVNKDLIGGFVLRMGDVQYDASVLKELKRLTREFNSNPYIRKN